MATPRVGSKYSNMAGRGFEATPRPKAKRMPPKPKPKPVKATMRQKPVEATPRPAKKVNPRMPPKPKPVAATKVTGRANALTRGNGKKIGLKRVGKVAKSGSRPSKTESFAGEFTRPPKLTYNPGTRRGLPKARPAEADGGFRTLPPKPSGPKADVGRRPPPKPVAASMKQADGGYRTWPDRLSR
jgi:hypothetical protein